MDDSLSLGDAGEISGTPAYMALEQIEGGPVPPAIAQEACQQLGRRGRHESARCGGCRRCAERTDRGLARLGLARALNFQGDRVKARAAYDAFLELWKDADPDVPFLRQARAEYQRLR